LACNYPKCDSDENGDDDENGDEDTPNLSLIDSDENGDEDTPNLSLIDSDENGDEDTPNLPLKDGDEDTPNLPLIAIGAAVGVFVIAVVIICKYRHNQKIKKRRTHSQPVANQNHVYNSVAVLPTMQPPGSVMPAPVPSYAPSAVPTAAARPPALQLPGAATHYGPSKVSIHMGVPLPSNVSAAPPLFEAVAAPPPPYDEACEPAVVNKSGVA
jgi:hypothetical protein